MPTRPRPRLTFGKDRRLRTAAQFAAVYRAGVVHNAGPLRLYSLPNDRRDHRLGLSVSRRVGSAVVRNCIKRRLREAFRLLRPDLPGAYDLVVVVHPHRPLPMQAYRQHLADAVARAHDRWSARPPDDPPAGRRRPGRA